MKILTVVGARPQFIKAAVVSRAVRLLNSRFPKAIIDETIVHTGQHYDLTMSQSFFEELDIPSPQVNLKVGSGSHGHQTGIMLEKLETVFFQQSPDIVLVYGDTNSTLAGALAAAKLHIPVAHVEAGLRSFNRRMPEEINRVLTDHVSNILFCPTTTAVGNLRREGIRNSPSRKISVEKCGDVMLDAVLYYQKHLRHGLIQELGLKEKEYLCVTVHRAENTDSTEKIQHLIRLFQEICALGKKIVFPVHPRTSNFMQCEPQLKQWLNAPPDGMILTKPLPYLEMQTLVHHSQAVITDSGGLQKEAFFHGVPSLILRCETEWVELVESGWSKVCGLDSSIILREVKKLGSLDLQFPRRTQKFFGNGKAGEKIVRSLAGSVKLFKSSAKKR